MAHSHGSASPLPNDTRMLGRPAVIHPGVSNGPVLSYTPIFSKHQEPTVIDRFLQLQPDAATEQFLQEYCTGGETIFTDAMAHVLKWMSWSRTDINATLGRGQMYVISHQAVRSLLTASGCSKNWQAKSILDVGAGDGNVTRTALEPLLLPSSMVTEGGAKNEQRQIVTTECSAPMATCLRARGYVCLETTDLAAVQGQLYLYATIDRDSNKKSTSSTSSSTSSTSSTSASRTRRTYDFISVFNVLDRADRPQSLLYDIRKWLTPEKGRCIISVVLPFCPFVEDGQTQRKPTEDLAMNGGRCLENASFERAVDCMITNVFEKSGFLVHSWSKTPYICSGDRTCPYYVLYDAVFCLSCPSTTNNNKKNNNNKKKKKIKKGVQEDQGAAM